MPKTQTPRRGRPSKFGADRTRGPLTIRLRDHVREDLEIAARASGRSLSEEVEYRLELALSRKDVLREEWGSDVFNIATSAARSLWHIERYTGHRWIEDEPTFRLFQASAAELIRNYRDLVLREARDTPAGPLEGMSTDDLAQVFASLGGISPPHPRPQQSAEARQAEAAHELDRWKRSLERDGSRPLPNSRPPKSRRSS